MTHRIKITIEGPQGAGKTTIRKAIEEKCKELGKIFHSYDPVYRFKPEQINFEGADVIIMVKQKNAKLAHSSDCALHNGPAMEPLSCDCEADPLITPKEYGSEFPLQRSNT